MAPFRKIDQDGNGSNDIEECGEAFRVSRILIVLSYLALPSDPYTSSTSSVVKSATFAKLFV